MQFTIHVNLHIVDKRNSIATSVNILPTINGERTTTSDLEGDVKAIELGELRTHILSHFDLNFAARIIERAK
jgi:hypothetical protein